MSSIYTNELLAIKKAITDLEADNFLIPEESRFNNVLKECVTLLKKHNYVIKFVTKLTDTVKDTRGLVAYFYYLLENRHANIVPFKDEIVDLTIAKAFVDKVKQITDFDFKTSLGLCAKLVEIVFRFEEEFNFNPDTLYSFRIFGQKEMHWVTEKAISIYNKEINDDFLLVKDADRETEAYERTHNIKFGFDNLEELIKIHKEYNNG